MFFWWKNLLFSPDAEGGGDSSDSGESSDQPKDKANDSPPTDRYEGLTADERQRAEQTDAVWDDLSKLGHEDRARVVQLARERNAQLEEETKRPKPPKSDDSKRETDKAGKGGAASERERDLEARLAKIEAERDTERKEREQQAEQRKQHERQIEATRQFNADCDAVLDEDEDLAGDKAERRALVEHFTVRVLSKGIKPADRKQAFKDFIAEQKARFRKGRSGTTPEYVRGKMADADATRGETGGGAGRAKERPKPSAENWTSGKTVAALKKKYGEDR